MKYNKLIVSGIIISIGALFSCGYSSPAGSKKVDTPTTGEIHISADISYKPTIDQEIQIFEETYPEATIFVHYKPENELYKDLEVDSIRLIIGGREMNEAEVNYFKQREIPVKTTHVAIDGVAFVVNKENPAINISYNTLKSFFEGKINLWSELNPLGKKDSIRMVFDYPGGSNVRYLSEKFLNKQPLPSNCFGVNGNDEVLEYIQSHPNAIGVISVNYISDNSIENQQSFLDKVNVVNVSHELNDSSFYGPYQAYIKNTSYPLRRNVYIISKEIRSGLGTGFTAFVAGDKGQRIIMRAGLVPAVAPVRVVNLNTNPDF